MCILVAKPLADRLVRSGLGDMIVYRPDLATSPDWRSVPVGCRPDALVVGGRLPDGEVLDAWCRAAGTRTPVIIRARSDTEAVSGVARNVNIREVESSEMPEDQDLATLIAAEAHVNRSRTALRLPLPGFPDSGRNSGPKGYFKEYGPLYREPVFSCRNPATQKYFQRVLDYTNQDGIAVVIHLHPQLTE
jgi:hypothetical protein